MHKVQQGDIVAVQWGGGAICDFYRVERMSPQFVTLQLMKKKDVGVIGVLSIVEPTDEPERRHPFGKAIRTKIRADDSGNEYVLIQSFKRAPLVRYDSATQYHENRYV